MQYIKIKFTKGLICEAYQEISNGVVVSYRDVNGNKLDDTVTESHVIDANPSFPIWGIVDTPIPPEPEPQPDPVESSS